MDSTRGWDGYRPEPDDSEDDQCGSVGDPRDPRTPVCCLAPGHAGPHMQRVVSLREIKEQS